MDNQKVETILDRGLVVLQDDITKNLYKNQRVASGKTAKSLKVVTKITGNKIIGTLFGSSVLENLEYGRGKTVNASGNATWKGELLSWMRIRGIPEGAFYPIWRKINRDGYKGTKGLISDPRTKFKNNFAKQLKSIIVKDFKNNGINSSN